MKPQRIQLSRKAGFKLQRASMALNGLPAKRITRPGKWGNPFSIDETAKRYDLDAAAAQVKAVGLCSDWLRGKLDKALSPGAPPSRDETQAELAGYNLACWCKPGTPCHGDVLIEMANS